MPATTRIAEPLLSIEEAEDLYQHLIKAHKDCDFWDAFSWKQIALTYRKWYRS